MVATIQRIRGLNFTSAPGMPQISVTAEDTRIASLPGIIHFFEPERLSGSPLSGRDRATVGHRVAATGAGPVVAPAAAFGGRHVVHLGDSMPPLAYQVGTCPPSFTMIIAASLDAGVETPHSAGRTLFAIRTPDPVNSKSNFRWNGTQYLFEDNFDIVTENRVPLANTPAAGTPVIWAISYDAQTRVSQISINGTDVIARATHLQEPDPITPADQLILGSMNFNTTTRTNWQGKIGRAIFLDRSYHSPAYVGMLADEITALREYYSI